MRGVIIENEYNYTYKNKVNKEINDFLSFFVIYVALLNFSIIHSNSVDKKNKNPLNSTLS